MGGIGCIAGMAGTAATATVGGGSTEPNSNLSKRATQSRRVSALDGVQCEALRSLRQCALGSAQLHSGHGARHGKQGGGGAQLGVCAAALLRLHQSASKCKERGRQRSSPREAADGGSLKCVGEARSGADRRRGSAVAGEGKLELGVDGAPRESVAPRAT